MYTLIMCVNLTLQIDSKCGNGTLSIMDAHDLPSSPATFPSEVAKIPNTYFEL